VKGAVGRHGAPTPLAALQALAAVVPTLARAVAGLGRDPKAAASLLDAPTLREARLVEALRRLLRALAMPVNSKLFAQLPEHAPAGVLLPLTGSTLQDARLAVLLVTGADGVPCAIVARVLEWQNRLRVLLSQLLARRTQLSKVRRRSPFLAGRRSIRLVRCWNKRWSWRRCLLTL
jgi:hypothetical protein